MSSMRIHKTEDKLIASDEQSVLEILNEQSVATLIQQAVAQVTEPFLPKVLEEPADVIAGIGDDVLLECLGSVVPSTTLGLEYQWEKAPTIDGPFVPLLDETTRFFARNPVLTADSGFYRCRLSNVFGPRYTSTVAIGVDADAMGLFGENDRGVIWDLDRMDHLFQLSNGYLPVTAYGDPVGTVFTTEKGGLDALGLELLTNGEFSADVDWVKGSGWTIEDGQLVGDVTGFNHVYQTVPSLSIGAIYLCVFEVNVTSGAVQVGIGTSGQNPSASISTSGTHSVFIRPTVLGATQFYIRAGNGFVGTVDNVTLKQVPGTHLVQTISSRRPTYARRPKSGIRNLVPSSSETMPWVAGSPVTFGNYVEGPFPDTQAREVFGMTDATNDGGTEPNIRSITTASNAIVATVGVTYTRSVYLKRITAGSHTARLRIVGATSSTTAEATITHTEWTRLSVTAVATAATTIRAILGGGGESDGVLVAGDTLEIGEVPTTYQKVTNQFDITEEGQPSINYLWFDGIDDCLQSALPVDFSNTDQMTVCVGARHLTGGFTLNLLEIGGTFEQQNQTVVLHVPSGANNYGYRSRGTSTATITTESGSYPTGSLNVITGQSEIGENQSSLSVNGLIVGTSDTDQGGGNYGNYVLNIGSRNQASNFFSGDLHSGFIVNKILDPLVLADFEQHWVAAKAGVDYE